jgi:hypothetical protein
VRSGCTKKPGKAQKPTWESHQTGKNPSSNSGLTEEAEGESNQLSKRTLVTALFGVKLCLSSSGSGVEVLCCLGV